MIQSFDKPGMGGGASAPLPSGGIQGGSRPLQQNAQRMVPNPGQFNGNPRGVYNTNFMGQGNAPSSIQQTNLGRYTPPTMQDGGRYGFNSNQWNNSGGYNYNLPGSYGSPQGQGQFAPMPGQFQQYMQPGMLSGNTFGFGSQFGPQFQQTYQQFYGGMGQNYLGGGSPYQGGRSGYMSLTTGGGGQWVDASPDEMRRQEEEYYRMTGRGRPPQMGTGGGMGGRPQFGQQVRGQLNQFGFNDLQIADDPQAFREWAAEAMNAPGQDPQYAAQIRAQLERMGGPMPPGKDGRPLRDPNQAGSVGMDPLSFLSQESMRNNGRGNFQGYGPAPMPAYDRPENRAYNMQALREMMGGF